ncbi:MAG: type II toxin-antitoxin system HicA family toxin [Bryobacteraceae bacterium]|nr:type II toxin-antitoxin system HicA family toxin [Bryobacteraceae bacterium]
MSNWPATKARRILAALERAGWQVKRRRGSHRLLVHPTRPDYEFSIYDQDEIGQKMLARIAKRTGLKPHDL